MTYPNHDEFFVASMGIKEIAEQCLQRILPPRVLQYAKLHTLYRENGTFVGNNQKHLSDILYSLDWEGLGRGFIYFLCEHKSQPDKLLPLQTGRYVYEILQDWKVQQEAAKQPTFPLPLVYVVIFYHGKQSPYPHSTDIRDCFGNREMAETLFNQPYQLVDLTQINDSELEKSGVAAGFQLIQKHIFERDNELFWQRLAKEILAEVIAGLGGNIDYLRLLMQYIMQYAELGDADRFIHLVRQSLPEHEDTIMTIAQQLEQRGMQKGMQKMARCLLFDKKREYTINEIVEMTGLTKEKIERLRDNDE